MTRRDPATLHVACVQGHWARPAGYNVDRTQHYIREAAVAGADVVLFSEANLTSYYFPYVIELLPRDVEAALDAARQAAADAGVWAIVGTIRKTADRFLNVMHVIDRSGSVTHEYAKVNLAGLDEKKFCRGGDKLSLFEIDGALCTLVICRDGRHPELYRLPAMAGAQILFHPSCSSDEIEAVAWKRLSGRAQQPVGPHTKIFHCVANTVGQSPDGRQTSSGASFIREPNGLPLAEAGFHHEEMITAVLDLARADRSYVRDSLTNPPFLSRYWREMITEVRLRADRQVE